MFGLERLSEQAAGVFRRLIPEEAAPTEPDICFAIGFNPNPFTGDRLLVPFSEETSLQDVAEKLAPWLEEASGNRYEVIGNRRRGGGLDPSQNYLYLFFNDGRIVHPLSIISKDAYGFSEAWNTEGRAFEREKLADVLQTPLIRIFSPIYELVPEEP